MSSSLKFHRLQNARLLCPPVSWSLLRFMSIKSVMLSNDLTLCHPPLLLPSSFPSIRVFSNEFTSGGQSIGTSPSATILSMNIQSWFFFRIDWFDFLAVQGTLKSLLTVRRHQFFSAQPFLLSSCHIHTCLSFPGGSDGKESAWNVGDLDSIPRLGRTSGERHGNPLQYSCLENPHGQRNLVGYSPWSCKEVDTTE